MDPRIDELRSLLREDPGSRRFFQLGEILRKENDLAGAEEVFRQGLEHHPRYVAAWVSLGRVQLAAARYTEAGESFAHALELDPENAVAARLVGEAAEVRRDWVGAVKAYKLARALSPRDPDLEVKIAQMELRIAGEPFDEESMAEEPAVPTPLTVGSDITSDDEITQVFDVEDEESPFAAYVNRESGEASAISSHEVFSLSDDDPFSVPPRGDTDVFSVAGDVFEMPEPPAEDVVFGGSVDGPDLAPAPDAASDVEAEEVGAADFDDGDTAPTPIVAVDDGDDADFDEIEPVDGIAEGVVEGDSAVEEPVPMVQSFSEPVSGEPVAEAAVDEAGAEVPAGESSEDEPLPTLTLARLAIDQGEFGMAEKMLMDLLEQDPGDGQARALLATLVSGGDLSVYAEDMSIDGEEVPASDSRVAKIAALNRWMSALREASERRSP